MKQLSQLLVLICVLALMGFSVGCDGGNAGGCGNWQVDPTPTPDPGTGDPPVLDRTHGGWQNPNCWGCHSQDSHNSGMIPADCVECHDDNGVFSGHGTKNCSNCHRNPGNHPASSFPSDSCLECH